MNELGFFPRGTLWGWRGGWFHLLGDGLGNREGERSFPHQACIDFRTLLGHSLSNGSCTRRRGHKSWGQGHKRWGERGRRWSRERGRLSANGAADVGGELPDEDAAVAADGDQLVARRGEDEPGDDLGVPGSFGEQLPGLAVEDADALV